MELYDLQCHFQPKSFYDSFFDSKYLPHCQAHCHSRLHSSNHYHHKLQSVPSTSGANGLVRIEQFLSDTLFCSFPPVCCVFSTLMGGYLPRHGAPPPLASVLLPFFLNTDFFPSLFLLHCFLTKLAAARLRNGLIKQTSCLGSASQGKLVGETFLLHSLRQSALVHAAVGNFRADELLNSLIVLVHIENIFFLTCSIFLWQLDPC